MGSHTGWPVAKVVEPLWGTRFFALGSEKNVNGKTVERFLENFMFLPFIILRYLHWDNPASQIPNNLRTKLGKIEFLTTLPREMTSTWDSHHLFIIIRKNHRHQHFVRRRRYTSKWHAKNINFTSTYLAHHSASAFGSHEKWRSAT